jgi:predicted TIM-barrel fold metal-dependent hydrolase
VLFNGHHRRERQRSARIVLDQPEIEAMQIVDAHHHLWDLEKHHYPWLANPVEHPAGDLEPIRHSYRLSDFLHDARNQDLVKSVHLQAAMDDPVAETAWLQGLADDPAGRGFPHAIVAYADLADPKVEEVLERHCEHRNMRGIRFMVNYIEEEPLYCMTDRGDWLRDPQWRKGYALLERYRLSFDLQVYCHQMADAADLASTWPGIQMMLNHAGLPHRRDADYVAKWRTGMRRLAKMPNVAAKISGLGMFDHHWTVESIRPFVLDTIEIFGIERCMFGSNFPVDRLSSDYDAIWNAFDRITADFSEPERRALFRDNAIRFYRL